MALLARRTVLTALFLCIAALLDIGRACAPNCQCTMVGSKPKPKVRKVDCSKHHAPFTSLMGITFPLDTVLLDLKKNDLTFLKRNSFMELSKLAKLNLSHNQITIIEAGAFAGLESLRRLDLSNNKIGTINSSMFTGLPKLEKLSLSHNKINTIPEGTFNDLLSLKRLDFNSDYLRCDCHLRWMVRWAKDKGVRILPSTRCALPNSMKGRIFSKLKRSDLHCGHDLQLPIFSIKPQESQIVFEGDKLPFNCQASIIHEDTSISWRRNGVQVKTNKSAGIYVVTSRTPDKSIIIHTLALNSLQKSHSGEWSCQVSTPQGKVSKDVSITVVKDPEKNCPHVYKVTNKGNYTWHETIAGVTVKKACEVGGKDDFATYYCNEFGYWENLNTSQCDYVSDRTRMLHRLAMEDVNATTVFEYLSRINMTLNLPRPIFQDMAVMDVVFVADSVEKLKLFVKAGADISDAIVEIVSNVSSTSPSTLRGAQMQKKASSRLVQVLDNITQEVAPPSPSRKWARYATNIAINVLKESESDPSRIYCALERPKRKSKSAFSRNLFSCSRLGNTTDGLNMPLKNIAASVDIPPTLLQEAGVERSEVNLQVSVYRDGALFPRTTTQHDDPALGRRNWTVVSQVISVDIGEPVLNLSSPIVLHFKVPDPESPLVAAYWDFAANGGLGDWFTDGCEIVTFIRNISKVNCYHLSNFAILQDYTVEKGRRSFIMEPIIYVGSCVCMLCMMAVIVTYITCFRLIYIPKKMKHSVINICISMLMLIVAFTMGINRTDLVLACQIAGIAIHYLTLCTIFWMTITSNNMFKKFLKAERPPAPPPEPVAMPLPPKPILRFYFLGWGVPIIICGITAAVNFNFYSGSEYCFLDWEPSLGAFYGPVALLVVLNLIFFLRISCVIRGQSTTLNETDETEEMHVNEIELVPNQADTNLEAQSLTQLHNNNDDEDDNASSISVLDQERRPITQLRALVAMLFLYILAWVCGAFAVAKPFKNIIPYQELIFSYLYGVTSALFGVFMVTYFCFIRRDSRLSWKRFFGCGPQPLYSFPVNTDPPTQVTQVNGNVVKSNSNMDVSTTYSQKSSNIAKAYQMKTNPGKQSNINLVPVPNSSKEGSVSSNQEGFPNFYNPRQNGAAKKFWQKNRHTHSKIMNKDVNRDLNCDSNTDNMSTSDVNRRLSQGTTSDANTHLSIEIQIQAKDSAKGIHNNHGSNFPNPGIVQLPMNIHHSSALITGPPMDRSHMTPVGGVMTSDPRGGAGSPCCNLTPPSHLPQHQRSPSACSLGAGHPSAFTPVAPRNNTLPRQLRPGVAPASPNCEYVVRDGSAPRVRDFDGQSQVSDKFGVELLPPPPHYKMPVLPSHVNPAALNSVVHSPPSPRPDQSKVRGLSPKRTSRPSSGERVHSPHGVRPMSGDYSSDSSRYRGHRRNYSNSSSVNHRTKGDGSKSPVMSDDQSRESNFMCPDSDGQIHNRRPMVSESDHHSDPTHRKRHRPYDKYSRHRGMQKQRSLGWEEQFRGRPKKIAYAYVNHSYQEKVLHKLISQASESDDLAKKAFWLPRSMSEYDRLTQSGFRGLLEDSSTTSEDDESFDNVWLPQRESADAFKKETSV